MLLISNEKYPELISAYNQMLDNDKARMIEAHGVILEFSSDENIAEEDSLNVYINPMLTYAPYVTENGDLTFGLSPAKELSVYIKMGKSGITNPVKIRFNAPQQYFSKDFFKDKVYPDIVNTLRYLSTTSKSKNAVMLLEFIKAIKAYEALFVQPQEAEK